MLAVLYVVEDIGLWIKLAFKLNVPVMVFVGFFFKGNKYPVYILYISHTHDICNYCILLYLVITLCRPLGRGCESVMFRLYCCIDAAAYKKCWKDIVHLYVW